MNEAGDAAAAQLRGLVDELRGRAVELEAETVADDLGKVSRAAHTLCTLFAELPVRLNKARTDSDRRKLRHDLRTPVNQILGYCELMQEETEEAGDDRWHDDLTLVQAQTQRLLVHIDAIDEAVAAAAVADHPREPGAPGAVRDRGSLGLSGPIVLRGDEERPGTALIVDDNAQNRDMLERRLRRDGLEVLTAADGAEALRIAAEMPVDVVLLDIMMPVMDGYETLERLKSDDELRHLPVIMLTSLDDPDSITRCIEAGAEDHLPKPFDPVLLRARIGSSLEKKKVRDLERAYLRRIVAEKRRADELIHGVIPIGVALSAERDLNRLLSRLLTEARRFCGADGGALLLRNEDVLEYVLLQCASIDLSVGGSSGSVVDLPAVALSPGSGPESPASLAARHGEPVAIPDLEAAGGVDLSPVRARDEAYGYRTHSLLALPLREVGGDVGGVLLLWNATEAADGSGEPFGEDTIDILESLSRLAGAALESYRRETELRQHIRRLEIRIDESNRRREVSEITETDYFRKLRDMAQKLRGPTGQEGKA